MDKKPGSLIGGMLLITGSCVGAGMLGLPILTGLAGFKASLLMFFLAWLFMTTTGFLLVEANGRFSHKVNFISMVFHSLGKKGKIFCWVAYLFLFYALLVAYISGSGSLFSSLMRMGFSFPMPNWIGSFLFVSLFGVVVYLGTRQVDLWNRILMAVKIFFFGALVAVCVPSVDPLLLTYSAPPLALFSLPLLVVSFGFHNMIPTLTNYMKGDLKRVRITIIGGSLFAFLIYLVWEVIVLGIVPVQGDHGLVQTFLQDREGSQALVAILQSPWIALFAQGLAFFAILTSFLAQALSLVHFLADGLQVASEKKESLKLCFLVLLPPLLLSLSCPMLFFKALNFAGGFCAVLLFGVLPALMVWVQRARNEGTSSYVVPGGKPLLFFILAFSAFVFFFQLLTTLGVFTLDQVGLYG